MEKVIWQSTILFLHATQGGRDVKPWQGKTLVQTQVSASWDHLALTIIQHKRCHAIKWCWLAEVMGNASCLTRRLPRVAIHIRSCFVQNKGDQIIMVRHNMLEATHDVTT